MFVTFFVAVAVVCRFSNFTCLVCAAYRRSFSMNIAEFQWVSLFWCHRFFIASMCAEAFIIVLCLLNLMKELLTEKTKEMTHSPGGERQMRNNIPSAENYNKRNNELQTNASTKWIREKKKKTIGKQANG